MISPRSRRRIRHLVLKSRVRFYRLLSDNQGAFEGTTVLAPVLAVGSGRIACRGATLGYRPSPYAFEGMSYIEARGAGSIEIGSGTVVNNDTVIISEGAGIVIGSDVLIGHSTLIVDSDFHDLDWQRRRGPRDETAVRNVATAAVVIEDGAFIGARSSLLKGVHIGEGAVVGAGSVVTGSVPAQAVVAGNPAKPVVRPSGEQPTS